MKTPLAALLCLALAGCLSPIALDRAVLEYDRTVHGIDSKLLLLNVARASQGLPVHFTTVSSIAASFEFRAGSGITGNVAKDPGEPILSASLTAEVAESPTISILPVQGEEFTRRLLAPFDETTFSFLVHQGADLSLLVRLLGTAVVVESEGERRFHRNDPSREEEYREFRRRVLHLAALHETGVLDVGPLAFEERLETRREGAGPGAPELALLVERGYRVETGEDGASLVRPVSGRLLAANYDPASLPNEERMRLERKAREYPRNFVLVDVRPGRPGGDYPFRGWIKLRSFNAVLEFVGSGIDAAPELHVDKAPETGSVAENPVKTLEILVSSGEEDALSATLDGRVYALGPGRWNRSGFRILHHLYQMTVTGSRPEAEIPVAITK